MFRVEHLPFIVIPSFSSSHQRRNIFMDYPETDKQTPCLVSKKTLTLNTDRRWAVNEGTKILQSYRSEMLLANYIGKMYIL